MAFAWIGMRRRRPHFGLCSDVKLHHTENFSATMAAALIGMRREAPENRLCSDVK
jgi:hypothetical protein